MNETVEIKVKDLALLLVSTTAAQGREDEMNEALKSIVQSAEEQNKAYAIKFTARMLARRHPPLALN